MSRKWVQGLDATTARRLVAAADRIEGYPRRGTDTHGRPIGPETWDGTGPTPLGWTRTSSRAVPALDGSGTVAVRLPADIADRAIAAGLGTEADRTEIAAAMASAADDLAGAPVLVRVR